MKSRSREILDKSIAAMLSAIEVYNKPNFSYREETFSILAISSWELLLKARILQIDNRISAILEYERRIKSDGELSEKYYRKKNRSGNHVSINLFKAFDRLTNDYGDSIDYRVRKNLEAMTEIRDNSVHFFNKDFELKKKVHEIGTATLKNYLNLIRQWFGVDLGEYNIFLMPIAFIRDMSSATAISLNVQERNLLRFVNVLEDDINDDETSDFNLSLDIDIRFKRSSKDGLTNVAISNSPDAIPITLEEENVREKYPWDYGILTKRLQNRYSNFKITTKYHEIRKDLEQIKKYCNEWFLDPGNPKSAKKNFYNPNILKEFDKHYKRKKL